MLGKQSYLFNVTKRLHAKADMWRKSFIVMIKHFFIILLRINYRKLYTIGIARFTFIRADVFFLKIE